MVARKIKKIEVLVEFTEVNNQLASDEKLLKESNVPAAKKNKYTYRKKQFYRISLNVPIFFVELQDGR